MIKFNVVIATHKNNELLTQCLLSLLATRCPSYRISLLMAGMTEYEIEAAGLLPGEGLLTRYRVTNDCLSANWNAGAAMGKDADVQVILNDDVEVPPRFFDKLEEGIVGHHKRLLVPTVSACGGVPSLRLKPVARPRRYALDPYEVCPSGVCFVIPTKFFEEIGGFDEDYRDFGAEDLDFCFRVWSHGGEVVIDEHLWLVHHKSASTSKRPDKWKIYARNTKLFHEKWDTYRRKKR